MYSHFAAILFAVLTGAAVLFQIALACGAPWGEFTLGGKYRGRLPRPVRFIPIVSAAVLLGFVLIVLAHAGLAFANIGPASQKWIWLVVGYCALGSVANAITPSPRERALWLPVLILMLGSSIVVGLV
jgi:multisubunit Na+/H+ antiporter MnhB subunit